MFGLSFLMTTGSPVVLFSVYRGGSQITLSGRVLQGEAEFLGEMQGILARSRGTEKERWRQLSHPISHLIIVRGVPNIHLRVGDVLRHQGRDFILNAIPYDVGGLGHWTELYCDERRDLQ